MPSSVLFAALAAAWLIVLVPMFARRRPGVSRTTDAALAARVVRRGNESGTPPEAPSSSVLEEIPGTADVDRAGTSRYEDVEPEFEDEPEPGQVRQAHAGDVRAGRPYRPGRGGFDPEAAALTARAKYARRQRIVVSMLIAVVLTAVIAAVLSPIAWWVHGCADLVLAGYLTYLRRQVRIEEDVRNRRLARLAAARGDEEEEPEDQPVDLHQDPTPSAEPERPAPVSPARPATPPPPGNAVVVEIDDEDPMFDELDERTWEPYRRAVGE